MATVPDFTVTQRVGDGVLYTTLNDNTTSSTAIISRKWILGDGTIIDGNSSSINHTYWSEGKYSVTLLVDDTIDLVPVTKENYIIVNKVYTDPQFIIMQSLNNDTGDYWKFYLDEFLHLVFETKGTIRRSVDAVGDINKWLYLEYNQVEDQLYYGRSDLYRVILDSSKVSNTAPMVVSESKVEIAKDSQLKLDELKIWSESKDLREYFSQTRGRAVYLDGV